MANYFKTDGTVLGIEPINGVNFELHELQELVGGYAQPIYLSEDTMMIVNEDGLLLNLQPNDNAMWVCEEFGKPHFIVGNALVCNSKMIR